jgi:hypothetical protein
MLSYYAIYKHDTTEHPTEPPTGIAFLDNGTGDGMIWDHMQKAWVYDPGLIIRFLDDYRNQDRFKTVDRATAEAVTLEVTGGKEGLPDEETIRWIFQWKGNPPQSDDQE